MSDDPPPEGAPTDAMALTALRRLTGRADAEFRDGQAEAIEVLVAQRRRALVVQRTGWGKSAVYFVATAVRRAQGSGPTLLVSPLLALMRDQIAAAQRAGIAAVTMNSANAQHWQEVAAALDADEVDVLLVSPERLNNPAFRAEQLPALVDRLGLLVVDEAHCVSDWGHDFRPDYRRIKDLLAQLPADIPVLATTATANTRVVADVAEQLTQAGGGRPPHQVVTIRGGLARESLRLGALPPAGAAERVAWLVEHLGELPGSGIIYTLTVSAAEDVAQTLRQAGHEVAAYTGRTDPVDRERLEDDLRDNRVTALVATSALGMGFDKPDLGFVVHVGAPSSPVAYYQQVGRAGRATPRADVLLMPGVEDREIWTYFASASMPRPEHAAAVLAALEASSGPLSTPALETLVDLRRTRLELLLKVLDVDGAVLRVRGGWRSTGQPWVYDEARYARVAQSRRDEQDLMLDYLRGEACRMAFLQQALDDATAAPCGRCDVCDGPWYPTQVTEATTAQARDSLSRVGVPLAPRTTWPTGMDRLGVDARGRLAETELVEPGQVVARLTDLGWGSRLRALLDQPDAPVPPEVLRGCVEVLAGWSWQARPGAVVAMPSRSHPQRVASLAAGLAQIGRLVNLGSLAYAHGGPTGERGGNSAYRLAGLWDRIVVPDDLAARLGTNAADGAAGTAGDSPGASVPGPGPVLLVDDLVDSRWTMTVAGRALRRAGAGAVLPFALASVG